MGKNNYYNRQIDDDYRAVSHRWEKTVIIVFGYFTAGVNLLIQGAFHIIEAETCGVSIVAGITFLLQAVFSPFDKRRSVRDTGTAICAWILCLISCGWGVAFSHSLWWILVCFVEGLLCFVLLTCMRWHYRCKGKKGTRRKARDTKSRLMRKKDG